MVTIGAFFQLVSILTVVTQALVLVGVGWLLRETALWMQLRSVESDTDSTAPRTSQSSTGWSSVSNHSSGDGGFIQPSRVSVAGAPSRSRSSTGSLVSTEERIVALLQVNRGRMRQQDLVDALGLSEAAVSRRVTHLEQSGRVVKLSNGRENVVCLPETAPPARSTNPGRRPDRRTRDGCSDRGGDGDLTVGTVTDCSSHPRGFTDEADW
ncbi:helix-turn-helix transcriptional regulator [Halobacteriaceae archaeon GCM10025711]